MELSTNTTICYIIIETLLLLLFLYSYPPPQLYGAAVTCGILETPDTSECNIVNQFISSFTCFKICYYARPPAEPHLRH